MADDILGRLLHGRRIAVLYLNFGPYHVARLRALAQRARSYGAEVLGVELSATEQQYPWRVAQRDEPFTWRTLVRDRPVEGISAADQRAVTRAALDETEPVVVTIPGWSHPFHRAAAAWCRRRRAIAILGTDSTANTRRAGFSRVIARRWYLEAYKRWLLRGFEAVQVSGRQSQQYIAALGMPVERIFFKCDAIDNDFFAQRADAARRERATLARQNELPESFFFYPARCLECKNHLRLLDAYERYADRAAGTPWGLMLLGSGPTERAVDARIAALGRPQVQRRPFAQIEDVARYYGLAAALVFPSYSETWGQIANEAAAAGLPLLVSDQCPVAEHLVVPGENGWTFDPYDVEQMAGVLGRLATLAEGERARMGAASRRIVADWGLPGFVDELFRAMALAAARPRTRRPAIRTATV